MAHKHNGVKPHLRADAGDTHSETSHECDSEVPQVVYPENIQKRLNALKHIHMDIQSLEQDMHTKLFLLEAEQHKKMAPLFKKRADIISGTQEPSAAEAVFKLKDDLPDPETTPADDRKGIPSFWSTVLINHNHTMDLIEEHDHEVLGYLADIRTVYAEKPLGFTLEFEFKENAWFSNKVLTRSYEFEDGMNVAKEDLYMSTGLQPKSTKGTVIDWKEGKNLLKGEKITFQRNKKTGERRQIKTPIEQESFFSFFSPSVTDLHALMKTPLTEADEEHAADHMQKIQDAEMEYELASAFRTRIIPRALLIFTEEDEEDEPFSDEEFGDEDDDDEEEGEEDEEGGGDAEQEEESDEEPPGKKGAAAGFKKGAGGGQGHGGPGHGAQGGKRGGAPARRN